MGDLQLHPNMAVAPEEFKRLPNESQMAILYGYVLEIHAACKERCHACDGRFRKLEKRKKVDTTVASLLGAVCGAAAGWLKAALGGR